MEPGWKALLDWNPELRSPLLAALEWAAPRRHRSGGENVGAQKRLIQSVGEESRDVRRLVVGVLGC